MIYVQEHSLQCYFLLKKIYVTPHSEEIMQPSEVYRNAHSAMLSEETRLQNCMY